MKGYRPWMYGEEGGREGTAQKAEYSKDTNTCAFPECDRPRKKANGRRGQHSYCSGHMKQRQRNGPDGMKPLNNTMSQIQRIRRERERLQSARSSQKK